MWCSWRTVSAPSGASRYQPLIGAEQATSLAGGLDLCSRELIVVLLWSRVVATILLFGRLWTRFCFLVGRGYYFVIREL